MKKDFKDYNPAIDIITTATVENPVTAAEAPKQLTLKKKERKDARIPLLVTPSFKAKLEKAAKAQGMSVNNLINTILENYLGE